MPLSKDVLSYLEALRKQEWPEGVTARTEVKHPSIPRRYINPKLIHDEERYKIDPSWGLIPFYKARDYENVMFESMLKSTSGADLMAYGRRGYDFGSDNMNERFDRARRKVMAEGLLSEYLKDAGYK